MSKKPINKDTYSYYKKSYRANKRYRDKIGSDDYGDMLDEQDFREMRESGLSTQDIVYNQFHFYSKNTAKQIQQTMKQKGFDYSIKTIQAKSYNPDFYKAIGEEYHELILKGYSSAEASKYISYTYYGS